jgi:hypothetical protein
VTTLSGYLRIFAKPRVKMRLLLCKNRKQHLPFLSSVVANKSKDVLSADGQPRRQQQSLSVLPGAAKSLPILQPKSTTILAPRPQLHNPVPYFYP